MKRWKRRALTAVQHPDPVAVTFRTLSVDFEDRTITLDGRVVQIVTRAVDLPILSGDAVFIWRRDMERLG